MTRCSALLTLLVLAAGSWFAPVRASTPTQPNVIFILLDDLGYADLGCQGARDIRTPNIDRIAKEGLRLRQFYANAPVCTPTRAAFITGRWQQRSGLEWALGFTAEMQRRVGDRWVVETDHLAPGLPATEVSIAQLLRRAGYHCGIFGKWHLGFRPEFNPVRHGFHEYFGVLTGHADYYRYNYFDGTYVLRENEKEVKAEGYLTDLLNQKAVAFIERRAGQGPFFLCVPHLAVHFPFQTPDNPNQKLTKQNYNEGSRAIYQSMVERVDQGVGQMLAALEKKGIADNTLVILSSDNGGYRFSDNAPLFHHKSTLWEGGVRVPCLLRWPKVLPQGKVVDQAGITMDLTATILNAAGAKLPEGHQLDGLDLLPILTGKQKEVERTFFWRIERGDRKQKAVRAGKWKYVKDGWLELLFDLERDVSERTNLSWRHPAVVDGLRRELARWEAEMDRSQPLFKVR